MTQQSPPTTELPAIDASGTPRVGFPRLVGVEWRKMMDTRAGFWLLLCTGLMLLAVMVIIVVVAAAEDSFRSTAQGWMTAMIIPVSLLIPLFGILTVTTEWSQRTHLVTFTLEPRRLRVMAAKLVAVTLLAAGTIVAAIALGALGQVLAGAVSGQDPVWNLGAGDLFGSIASQVLFFLMGFGLALLLLNTPGAIALFYVFGLLLPFMIYAPLMMSFGWAADLFPWIDLSAGTEPVLLGTSQGMPVEATGIDYARAVVATLIWVVLPIGLGMWRVSRAEVK